MSKQEQRVFEKSYYKVVNKECALYRRASEFIEIEQLLKNIQYTEIKHKIPAFSEVNINKILYRVPVYEGFVFVDQSSVCPKTWRKEEYNGHTLFVPNLKYKEGMQMNDFLKSFERTTSRDLEVVLNLYVKFAVGEYFAPEIISYKDCIYIAIDARLFREFERNNPDAIEITRGEARRAAYGHFVEKKTNMLKTV